MLLHATLPGLFYGQSGNTNNSAAASKSSNIQGSKQQAWLLWRKHQGPCLCCCEKILDLMQVYHTGRHNIHRYNL